MNYDDVVSIITAGVVLIMFVVVPIIYMVGYRSGREDQQAEAEERNQPPTLARRR